MAVTERELHAAFHRPLSAGAVDVAAVLAAGRRRLRRRRLRRTSGALILPVAVAAAVGLSATGNRHPYQLVGSGLTLAQGSVGPVQVATERVDLGDGIQAWRKGVLLYIGYPHRPYLELDTKNIHSRWENLGYDAAIFTDPGQHPGSTIVVGTVRGKPTSVVVTLEGVSQRATIACFKQAPGWCSYKANVPASFRDNHRLPDVHITEAKRPS